MHSNSADRRSGRFRLISNSRGQKVLAYPEPAATGSINNSDQAKGARGLPFLSHPDPAAIGPINNSNQDGGHLTGSYVTESSIEFANRRSRHRDENGRLLNTTRPTDDDGLIDTIHLISPGDAIRAFGYTPADPYFTPTEQLKFAIAYRETPASFGTIATHLPGRTHTDCINHYYRYKFDGRFKDESRKKRYDRLPALQIDGVIVPPPQKELMMSNVAEWDIRLRGVGPQNPVMAADEVGYHNNGRPKRKGKAVPNYVAADDPLLVVPIEIHIAELKEALGIAAGARVFEMTRPSTRRAVIVLPRPFRLEVLSENFPHPFNMIENQLMHWLRSETVLPLIAECFNTVVRNQKHHEQLFALLEETSEPYVDIVGDLAHLAHKYRLWTPPDLKIYHQEILIVLAQFAYRIGRANADFLNKLNKTQTYPDQSLSFDGAFVLLFALADLKENEVDGFFAILVYSELAGMMKSTVRSSWERIYSLEDEDVVEEGEEEVAEDMDEGMDEDMEDVAEELPEGYSTDDERFTDGDDPTELNEESLMRSQAEWSAHISCEGKQDGEKDRGNKPAAGTAERRRTDSGTGRK